MHLTAAFWRRWQRERICGRQLILPMPWQPCLYRKSVLRPPCRSGRRLTHSWLRIVRPRIADAQTLNIGIVKAQSKLRNQRNYRQKNQSQKNHSQMDHGQKNTVRWTTVKGAADKRAAIRSAIVKSIIRKIIIGRIIICRIIISRRGDRHVKNRNITSAAGQGAGGAEA